MAKSSTRVAGLNRLLEEHRRNTVRDELSSYFKLLRHSDAGSIPAAFTNLTRKIMYLRSTLGRRIHTEFTLGVVRRPSRQTKTPLRRGALLALARCRTRLRGRCSGLAALSGAGHPRRDGSGCKSRHRPHPGEAICAPEARSAPDTGVGPTHSMAPPCDAAAAASLKSPATGEGRRDLT